MTSFAATDIRATTDGRLPPGTAAYAQEKIAATLHLAHRPVLSARVRVTRHGDPAVPNPVVAQVNLDVSGRLVRVQAEGDNAHEAIDLAQARLRRRLERIAQHWEARRGGMPSGEPHEWRHESEPAHRHRWYPRPAPEREIVRHKSFALARCTVDEAARDMGLLDYDFYLFTEAGTGRDSVLYRAGATGYRLAQLTPPGPHELAPCGLPLTISDQPAPELTTDEAANRLGMLGLPFLFFLDAERGRGAVIYHRYDGHYGLITPALGER
ncbi:ribosome hibernation promotion factor [Amycolatopsis alkalitolerans]|uniref:HPF/RaiA family ribosome-associated protein n=1 Tax=Amycolatopsis alkalitolerans TaxID=2547244 RepID=A0A5C4LTF0_9PSEU|nr:HPF/RaiA family ribosome-associated protein [Amycolatopsis alkalitolerans]TNC20467.1 HPF/RaiA family ribosome-associated protein [Amycolatopsis alkalitolerans]